ncbi:MAG: hypothetical protein ACYC91_19870 [Solirubrobacteraceae bacterium]
MVGIGVLVACCGIGLAIYGDRFVDMFDFATVRLRRKRTRLARLSRFVSRWGVPTVFIIGGTILIVLGVGRSI